MAIGFLHFPVRLFFVKAIDNDEKDGYSENWVHNHEMSVEEYQKQLKIKE